MDWFRRGFSDMGKLVNQVGESIDFSWILIWVKHGTISKMTWLKAYKMDCYLKVFINYLMEYIPRSKASDKVNVLGKGVSKETKSAFRYIR